MSRIRRAVSSAHCLLLHVLVNTSLNAAFSHDHRIKAKRCRRLNAAPVSELEQIKGRRMRPSATCRDDHARDSLSPRTSRLFQARVFLDAYASDRYVETVGGALGFETGISIIPACTGPGTKQAKGLEEGEVSENFANSEGISAKAAHVTARTLYPAFPGMVQERFLGASAMTQTRTWPRLVHKQGSLDDRIMGGRRLDRPCKSH